MIQRSPLPAPTPRIGRQQGGMTIVMALILLVVMSLAAFSLSRNAIRELTTSGHLIQGDKASESADAGLDWYLVWSLPANTSLAYSTTTSLGNNLLAKALTDLTALDWHTRLANDGLLLNTSSSMNWDRAALVTSQESQTADNQMVFDNTSTSAVYQAKNSGGSPVVQRFDLQIRWLGKDDLTLTGTASGSNGGGTNYLWQVISTGYAAVPMGGGNYLRYQQRRELILTAPPSQSAAAGQ